MSIVQMSQNVGTHNRTKLEKNDSRFGGVGQPTQLELDAAHAGGGRVARRARGGRAAGRAGVGGRFR